MTQLTEKDLTVIKELINANTQLILQKIESTTENLEIKINTLDNKIDAVSHKLEIQINAVSDKLDSLDKRVEQLERNSDKVTNAVIIAMLSGFIAILVKSIVTLNFFSM